MAHDILTEGAISLNKAAREFPPIDGKRPSPCSVWRWARVGVRGVRLQYAMIGRRIVTSKPALSRFAAALAESAPTPKSFSGRKAAGRR